MASANEFVIKCKSKSGSFVIKDLNSESTVRELKIQLSRETEFKPEQITILLGYPPRALTGVTDSSKLKDVNIHSGETIIVDKSRDKNDYSHHDAAIDSEIADTSQDKNDDSRNDAATDSTTVDKSQDTNDYSHYDASIDSVVRRVSNPITVRYLASGASEDLLLPAGTMMRHAVPANNSCLFTSVHFVLTNGDKNTKIGNELRKLIARVVAGNPEKYTEAFLGKPNEEYCDWIQNTRHWGGGIELSILSEHFGVEIVAVDTVNLNLNRFGENCNYENRIFLLYDGVHYDPLVLETDGGPMQTVFPVKDDRAMEMAQEIALETKLIRQCNEAEMANFTVRCGVCEEWLFGENEASEHALATGHTNFEEV